MYEIYNRFCNFYDRIDQGFGFFMGYLVCREHELLVNTTSFHRFLTNLCKFFECGASWKRLTKYWRNWKRWAI